MKIKKSDLEIAKLTTKHLLLSLFDLIAPSYLATRTFRRPIKKYLEQRIIDHATFFQRIQYLKRQGYIETFVEGKEKYVELTAKGKKRANELLIEDLEINRPPKWDKKWRVVIFDIPEDKKHNRDIFRERLINLGFIQIQKSVYVYPFECAQEIAFVSNYLLVQKYVTIMIAEIIQGEEKIVNEFLESNILKIADLKSKSK
jgi:CRISPR-associated endonuclease Cas2